MFGNELSYCAYTLEGHLLLLHSSLLFHCINVILNIKYVCLTVKHSAFFTYHLITTLANIGKFSNEITQMLQHGKKQTKKSKTDECNILDIAIPSESECFEWF